MKTKKPPLFPECSSTTENESVTSDNNNNESTPLVSSSLPQYSMQNRNIISKGEHDYSDTDEFEDSNGDDMSFKPTFDKNDDNDDDDDDAISLFSHVAFPWAFQNVSSSIIPSNREIVEESEEEHDDEEEDEKESVDNIIHKSHTNRIIKHHNYNHHHHHKRTKRVIFLRSLRRRIFLLLTEPQSSIASAIFFIFLIVMIAVSNILMMMQTCTKWSFTPTSCFYCSNLDDDVLEDDDAQEKFYDQVNTMFAGEDLSDIECICPPMPLPRLVRMEDAVIAFFAIEWSLRVLCYEPPPGSTSTTLMIQKKRKRINSKNSFYTYSIIILQEWISFLLLPSTIIDALAIFPYYLEEINQINGFLSLRLLRLFRVFQLLRLGKYNTTFMTLRNVLYKSLLCLNVLMIVLIFGAAFFGSIIYWLERGKWSYTTYTDPPSFMYMRLSVDGVTEEPSPFSSIPAAFWWFIVTATTVGYGDVFPTSLEGKLVGTCAMLTGVLVIAFPVSVFSDLWSKELRKVGVFDVDDDEDIGSQKSCCDYDPQQPKRPRRQSSISSSQLARKNSGQETKEVVAASLTMNKNKDPPSRDNLKFSSTFLGFGDPREFRTLSSNSIHETNGNKSKNNLSNPIEKKRQHRRCKSDSLPVIKNSSPEDEATIIALDIEFNKQESLPPNITTNSVLSSNSVGNYDLVGLDFLENSPLQQQRKTKPGLVLTSSDVDTLRLRLASIDESQKVIRRILGERSNDKCFNREHQHSNGCDRPAVLSS